MDLSAYPFKSYFHSTAKIITPDNYQEGMAKASISSLKGFLPDGINPEEDPDLLYFAANGAVAGMCNLNDDCLDITTALQIFPKTKNKYINVDHKKEIVVGTILSSGLSRFNDSKPLSVEEADGEKIFNLSVVGINWRAINPNLANALIESSDISSPSYGDISLSWEIYFKGYDIAIGSQVLREATVITDEVEKEKMKPFLRCNGGSGMYEGEKIYRVIRNTEDSNNVIIAGYSWVVNPAAAVKGLITFLYKEGDDEDDKNEESDSSNKDAPQEILDENKNNSISHSEQLNVIQKIDTNKLINIMDIKTLEDISAQWQDFSKLEQAEACAKITEVLKSGIEKASEEYSSKLNSEKEAVAEAKRKLKEVEDSLAEVKVRAETTEKELTEVRAAQEASFHQEKFNERLASIDAEFDLEADDRAILASEIMGLDDESYAKYKKKFDTLAKSKNKKVKAEMKEKMMKECKAALEAEAAKASVVIKSQEELAAEALASAELEKEKITAGIKPEEGDLVTKYQAAFNPAKK